MNNISYDIFTSITKFTNYRSVMALIKTCKKFYTFYMKNKKLYVDHIKEFKLNLCPLISFNPIVQSYVKSEHKIFRDFIYNDQNKDIKKATELYKKFITNINTYFNTFDRLRLSLDLVSTREIKVECKKKELDNFYFIYANSLIMDVLIYTDIIIETKDEKYDFENEFSKAEILIGGQNVCLTTKFKKTNIKGRYRLCWKRDDLLNEYEQQPLWIVLAVLPYNMIVLNIFFKNKCDTMKIFVLVIGFTDSIFDKYRKSDLLGEFMLFCPRTHINPYNDYSMMDSYISGMLNRYYVF